MAGCGGGVGGGTRAAQLKAGVCNLQRHITNTLKYGIPVVVAINQFGTDTEAELNFVKQAAKDVGAFDAVICNVRSSPASVARVRLLRVPLERGGLALSLQTGPGPSL